LQPSKKVIEINISLVENEKDGKKEEKEKNINFVLAVDFCDNSSSLDN
jgi:hypothetical protein